MAGEREDGANSQLCEARGPDRRILIPKNFRCGAEKELRSMRCRIDFQLVHTHGQAPRDACLLLFCLMMLDFDVVHCYGTAIPLRTSSFSARWYVHRYSATLVPEEDLTRLTCEGWGHSDNLTRHENVNKSLEL